MFTETDRFHHILTITYYVAKLQVTYDLLKLER